MDVKKIICPLSDALNMKHVGIKQDSIFYYVNGWKTPNGSPIEDGEHVILAEQQHITKIEAKKRGAEIEFVSAFTVGELGIMLGNGLNMCSRVEEWEDDFHFETEPNSEDGSYSEADTEAEIRIAELIELIENGEISIEKINSRIGSDNIISSDNF